MRFERFEERERGGYNGWECSEKGGCPERKE